MHTDKSTDTKENQSRDTLEQYKDNLTAYSYYFPSNQNIVLIITLALTTVDGRESFFSISFFYLVFY